MGLISLSVSLFLLMDAIGNVPIFLSVLKELEPNRQRKIIFRELVIALLPVADAPKTMLIAASSLSLCTNTRPSSGILLDMYAATSFCGVIG